MRRLVSLSILASIVLSLAFTFQNCGGPIPNTSTTNTSVNATSTAAQNAPFAYDTTINQITYMSCHQASFVYATGGTHPATNTAALQNPNGAFFTFKAGAYGNAGIKLNSTFISYASQNLVTQGSYDMTQLQDALQMSTINSNLQLQLALRADSDLVTSKGYYSFPNQTPDTWYANMLAPLSSDFIVADLKSAFINRFSFFGTGGNSLKDRLIEGYLSFNDTSGSSTIISQDILRASLTPNCGNNHCGSMTVTYQGNGSNLTSDTTQKYPNEVWGSGYKFTFVAPQRGGAFSPSASLLSGVHEMDLSQPPGTLTGGTWSCPSTYQFMIIDKTQWKANPTVQALCPVVNYNALTADKKAIYDTVSRHLPSDTWMINPNYNCAVYTYNNGNDNYDCYQNTAAGDVEYFNFSNCATNNSNHRECADYISVCLRN